MSCSQPSAPSGEAAAQAHLAARRVKAIQSQILEFKSSLEDIHVKQARNDEALIKLGFNIPAGLMHQGREMREEVEARRRLQSDIQLRMNVMFKDIELAHNELSSIRAAEESKRWSQQVQHDIWGEIRNFRQQVRDSMGEVSALQTKVSSLEMDDLQLKQICFKYG